MSDMTITAEERSRLRAIAAKPNHLSHRDGIHAAQNNLLDALEQTEAQLAAALQVNAARQAAVTADMLNAMMAGITGQKESVRVEVDGFQCPYCNETSKTIEDATAHDTECPKHPAVIRAEQAEANVARLTKERYWLAMHLSGYDDQKKCTVYTADWIEAARRAVADSEVKG